MKPSDVVGRQVPTWIWLRTIHGTSKAMEQAKITPAWRRLALRHAHTIKMSSTK